MIWQTILITVVVFAVVLAGMAVGVIISNRRLKGSCGGLANLRDAQGRTLCDLCSHPSPDCDGTPATDAAHGPSSDQHARAEVTTGR